MVALRFSTGAERADLRRRLADFAREFLIHINADVAILVDEEAERSCAPTVFGPNQEYAGRELQHVRAGEPRRRGMTSYRSRNEPHSQSLAM